jgi:ferric-dicitrate binding protein FerR (iron transport regulator)
MSGDDHRIEALLRATGKRPAVSPERTRRVHDAARAAWQGEVRRRRTRRRVVRALVLAAAIALPLLAVWQWRSPTVPARGETVGVARIVNAAWIEQGRFALLRSRSALAEGASVTVGTTVSTDGDGRVSLRAATGASLRLDHFTTLRILSGRTFYLERGAIYVSTELGAASGAPSLRIETSLGTLEDVGTQFLARLGADSLSVQVREGTVRVSAGARTESAGAGQRISIDGSGRIGRSEDPRTDADWAWVEFGVRMIDIDGLPLSEFLDWAARERGGRVRYADPAIAQRAPSIVLRGSVAGMSLDRAIESVTATSGLAHRWEGRELVIGEAR